MPLTGHRILLVEDEALIAMDVKAMIRKANGEVVAYAASLAKALKIVNTPGLSLAVLDFRLGSENSLPVATKLHAAGVPFVFYTGNAANIPEIWPGVPILPKPADPARLIGTLASLWVKRPSYAAA
jgi:DNA-binding response OmpR family regulator